MKGQWPASKLVDRCTRRRMASPPPQPTTCPSFHDTRHEVSAVGNGSPLHPEPRARAGSSAGRRGVILRSGGREAMWDSATGWPKAKRPYPGHDALGS